MAEPGCEKCSKAGPVIQLGVFFNGYEKRDDGYSYPAYDECTSRYLCRTCADEAFAKCKDVFDRCVMGGEKVDKNCDRCGTDVETKCRSYPGDGCHIYRLCEQCECDVEDAVKAFIEKGGDDEDVLTRVDRAMEYAEEHCYDVLGRLAGIQQDIRAARNLISMQGGDDDADAKEAIRPSGEGQADQS